MALPAPLHRVRRTLGFVGLTDRGWWCLASVALTFVLAAWCRLPALLWVTGLAMALLVLALGYVLLMRPNVRVRREVVPEVVEFGDALTVDLTVVNRSSHAIAAGLWREPVGVGHVGGGSFPAIGAAGAVDSTWTTRYTVRLDSRGRHAIGPLQLESTDPFALVAFRRTLSGTATAVVLPRRRRLSAGPGSAAGTMSATVSSSRSAGSHDEDVMVRPYAPGDPMKRVNWKSTARTGRLMVRQEERQLRPQIRVVVDTDSAVHDATSGSAGRVAQSRSFEWCVSLAASMITELPRHGLEVALASHGQRGAPGQFDSFVSADQRALVELAELELGDVVTVSDRRDETVVLMLGTATPVIVSRYRDLLAGSRVVALVTWRTPDPVVETIRTIGWTCVSYDVREPVAATWSRVAAVMC